MSKDDLARAEPFRVIVYKRQFTTIRFTSIKFERKGIYRACKRNDMNFDPNSDQEIDRRLSEKHVKTFQKASRKLLPSI